MEVIFFSFFSKYFLSSVILWIPMIPLEKSHQNLSDYNQFLFKKRFEVNEKQIFSSEEMRNSGNCIYDYAHSFFGEDFNPIRYTGIEYISRYILYV